MARRDDFLDPTKREIAGRAGYVCSFPGCGRMTVGPSDDRASGLTMVGSAAHISAAAPGGERYDASLTPDERRAAANGIWMCAIHGKWIDDNPSVATTEKLQAWKAAHEAEVSAWVEHGHAGICQSWDRLAALTRDQRDTIETCLPNGHIVTRDGAPLTTALAEAGACMVSGDSGVGKSALVKATLDLAFPEARQIWLGPEALRDALSEANREGIGLTAPLSDILDTSAVDQNMLVLDAVERADGQTIARLAQLVSHLAERRSTGEQGWQVIAIGQQAGFEVHLDALVAALDGNVVTISALGAEQVGTALQSVPVLAQHAYDDAFVALLGNIRTLGWIVAAAPLFAGADTGRLAARSRIADRLWAHWTGGDPDLHSFMIRLARRDADYERSFALSDLSQEDRAAWRSGRQRMPLALSARNRLSFEHDLASDWARYQHLKEIARDVRQWSRLATQPLWVAALRLFGQFLLREADQACDGWDWAFAKAQAETAADAVDVLLDALCLDPRADMFLSERADLLFANKGRLLDRLVARFLHIATVPERTSRDSADLGVQLYAEAEMRSPIWGAWPPLLRFIGAHRATIAAFGSTTVARLCEMWLTKAPLRIGERATLGRGELAELALETARTHQIANIAHATYGGSSDTYGTLFSAALAGAEDRLGAVSQFAKEMARRVPLAEASQNRIDAIKAKERERREALAAQQPPRQRSRSLTSFDFVRKLPPWPMGPAGRLEGRFREVVLKKGALNTLMRCAPDVATEVLLACIVEDNPHEEMRSMRIDWSLGLDHDHDTRPTIYWNSPFFPFLLHAPEQALAALLRLLNFCTERWAADEEGDPKPNFELAFADGARTYVGNRFVLDWSHSRRSTNSQLFSALDALERWLFLKIERGEDVEQLCEQLFAQSRSAAILGILANCAKQRPELLRGVLAPLLTSPTLILQDESRIGQRGFDGDWFAWRNAGEELWALASQWQQAAHRTTTINRVVSDLRRASPEFDAQARRAFDAWPEPDADSALRQRALLAELDPANWYEGTDAGGASQWQFQYPPDIAAEIEAIRAETPKVPSLTLVLKQLEAMLGAPLSDAEAAELYETFDEEEVLSEFGDVERRLIETAIAALLLTGAAEWTRQTPAVAARLAQLLEREVGFESDAAANADGGLDFGPGLVWACLGAVSAKAAGTGPPELWDRILAFGIATGEPGVIRTIIAAARGVREQIGDSWRGVVEAGIWVAAIEALRPRMEGDPGSIQAIGRWRNRLARRPLAGRKGSVDVDLVDVAERVDRLWQGRFRRQFGEASQPRHWRGKRRRYSLGISTFILAAIFDWALNDDVDPPIEARAEHRQVLGQLWRFVEWRLRGDPDQPLDEHDGFDRLDEFGLSVIRALAARIPLGTVAESRPLWEPVLALGPRGEFTLEHLIDCLFLRLYKEADPANFAANWEAMLTYVFAPGWFIGGPWYKGRSILRHMLGIDAAHQLAASPMVMARVPALAPYFKAFAAEHIALDDSALAAFAYFLASDPGEPLRLQGILWLDTAIAKDDRELRSNASGALAELANILLTRHDAALVADRPARQALINVIGRMVRDQAPLALALQDRARALR